MSLEKYKTKLLEWRKSREAATSGEWFDNGNEIISLNQKNLGGIAGSPNDENNKFIVLSANRCMELIDAHIKAIECLQYILKKNPNAVNQLEAADMAVEFHMKAHIALSQITEKK